MPGPDPTSSVITLGLASDCRLTCGVGREAGVGSRGGRRSGCRFRSRARRVAGKSHWPRCWSGVPASSLSWIDPAGWDPRWQPRPAPAVPPSHVFWCSPVVKKPHGRFKLSRSVGPPVGPGRHSGGSHTPVRRARSQVGEGAAISGGRRPPLPITGDAAFSARSAGRSAGVAEPPRG